MLTKQHLRNVLLDGVFYLPRHQTFWSNINKENVLFGERKEMGSELACYPMFLSDNKKALLVSIMDSKNQTWYS